MRTLKIIITGFIVSISSTAGAVTDAHIGYCDDIESTAAALKCITEHKQDAEKALSKVFEALNMKLEEDQKSNFLEAHKDWITYRDSQCKWEAKVGQASLSKLQESSCITKLTEERAQRLENKNTLHDNPEEAQEFSAFPRWLNALYKKHPTITWNVKSQQNQDINCDDIEDHILEGVSFSKDEELENRYKLNRHLAIVNGQDTGKPSYDIVNTTEICEGSNEISVSVISKEQDQSETPTNTSEEGTVECLRGIEIVFENVECEPEYIFKKIDKK